DPGELARELVGPEKEDLHHVDEDDRDHEVRAPAVHGADEPSEGHVLVEGLQAAPGFPGGRRVDEREEDPGHELLDEDDERGAAEHVPPARGVARHRVLGRFADGGGELQPGVEPLADLRELQAHGGFSPRRAATPPGVGSSPAWMVRTPFSTLAGYSKSPRSGGPEARAPSR